MAVALHVLPGHGAVEDVEGGKQRGGTVPLVIVRHGSAAALFPGQAGLSAVKGLNLALFVDGQNERMCGRRHIKPNDILKLFNELGVFREFELPEPVAAQAVAAPNALHRTRRNATSLGHRGCGPVRHLARRRPERQFHHPSNGFLRKLAGLR